MKVGWEKCNLLRIPESDQQKLSLKRFVFEKDKTEEQSEIWSDRIVRK